MFALGMVHATNVVRRFGEAHSCLHDEKQAKCAVLGVVNCRDAYSQSPTYTVQQL